MISLYSKLPSDPTLGEFQTTVVAGVTTLIASAVELIDRLEIVSVA